MGNLPPSRYPGAYSFSDDYVSRRVFFGRALEIEALTTQILANRLVVLFARSGLGKTSLLKAGVAQPLRNHRHLPIMVRLNDVTHRPFDLIVKAVENTCRERQIEYVPGSESALWDYLKTMELWSEDVLMTPVLILDQFEELFTLHEEGIREEFVDQLSSLFQPAQAARDDSDVAPFDVCSQKSPSVRVVISIREDYLYCLEDLADRIPSILDQRCRLKPLTRTGAFDAISKPAMYRDVEFVSQPFTIDELACNQILDFLSTRSMMVAKTREPLIDPFQLQLICQYIEAHAHNLTDRNTSEPVVVTPARLGGDERMSDVLRSFYTAQLDRIPSILMRRRVRTLCGEGLISADGRRIKIEESDVLLNYRINIDVLNVLVRGRLLKAEHSPEGTYYELSHDALVHPILDAYHHVAIRGIVVLGVQVLLVSVAVMATLVLIGIVVFLKNSDGWKVSEHLAFASGVTIFITMVCASLHRMLDSIRDLRRYMRRVRWG